MWVIAVSSFCFTFRCLALPVWSECDLKLTVSLSLSVLQVTLPVEEEDGKSGEVGTQEAFFFTSRHSWVYRGRADKLWLCIMNDLQCYWSHLLLVSGCAHDLNLYTAAASNRITSFLSATRSWGEVVVSEKLWKVSFCSVERWRD